MTMLSIYGDNFVTRGISSHPVSVTLFVVSNSICFHLLYFLLALFFTTTINLQVRICRYTTYILTYNLATYCR